MTASTPESDTEKEEDSDAADASTDSENENKNKDGDTVSLYHGMTVVDREDDDPNPAVVINCPKASCDEWDAYYDREKERSITVAEDNPDYDADAPVIVVSFLHDIRDRHPDVFPINDPLSLADLDCSFYSFPPGRLRVIDEEEIDDELLPEEEIGNTYDPDDSSDGEDDGDSESDTASDAETDGDSESDADAETDSDSDADDTDAEDDEEDEKEELELSDEFADLRDRLAESATVSVGRDGETPILNVEKLGDSYQIEPDGTITGDGALRSRLEPIVEEYLSDTA